MPLPIGLNAFLEFDLRNTVDKMKQQKRERGHQPEQKPPRTLPNAKRQATDETYKYKEDRNITNTGIEKKKDDVHIQQDERMNLLSLVS
ncbi:hypothetical protein OXB_2176 [Bacillus sp. OxB-1]|nr:hypothetical protein OXB_2176 [Bacillus sp. OxB-1]